MRQITIPKAGPPDILRLEERPDPKPAPGEVTLRVTAAGINFADIMARIGLYPDAPPFPCVVGYEVSGHIEALGEGVTGLHPGQPVAALTRFGGYADRLAVPAAQVFPIPDGLDLHAAAGLPVTYITAWLMLIHLGNVQSGDRVLIHSAGGGVGLSAIQLCRWRGAEVIGTASKGKHERLHAMGVAHCIDYRTQDFEAEVKRITDGAGVDIVLDAQGGHSFKQSYRCLTDLGRLYAFGVATFAPGERRSLLAALKGFLRTPRFHPLAMMDKNLGVQGINLGHLWHRAEKLAAMMHQIVALAADGTLAPVIDKTFPLEEAAAAHAYIQARKNFGKVLLTM